MINYASIPEKIEITRDGSVFVEGFPGNGVLQTLLCPVQHDGSHCTVQCAKCSVTRTCSSGLWFWTLNTCGCKRFAKELLVETQDSYRNFIVNHTNHRSVQRQFQTVPVRIEEPSSNEQQ